MSGHEDRLYHPLTVNDGAAAVAGHPLLPAGGLLMGHGASHVDTARVSEAPPEMVKLQSALDRQEGGGHYKGMAIQPFEYIHANGIGFAEGAVIKYVSRWRAKAGIEDLKKARHFLDLLIEAEQRKATTG